MTVLPIESLPLGFRFHPTDEELVNHYLKRKINGRIRSEIEVIPEIDICKCEPWDLPVKALIRSDDPEWFFFSPKDRKYPNGHRSNRATDAGYWKATGKDRVIRTKATAPPAVIGMKKTLVFHRGRAPKGVRTNWIMHEYRATEPEFESGEQGGYVLYRLFNKAEEKSPSCNGDEMEMGGFSPTPTKSSPGDTQHETDAFEQLGSPAVMTPINQVSPVSDIQEDPQPLVNVAESQTSGITRWLADKADHSSMKPEDCHRNSHVPVEREAEAGAVVDPLLDALGPFFDPKGEQIDSNGFPIITSPMRPYSNHPFFGHTDQESHLGFYQADYTEHDSMNEFLNSILSNPEEYSGGSNVQQISTPEVVIHSRSSSEVDTEVGLVQGGGGQHDPGWFMDASSDYREINSGLYENTSLLPCDSTEPNVYSESGAESLQELFNSMPESDGHMNAFRNGVGLEEIGITGIKIRSRQARHPAVDNLATQQGFARRRIRLQSVQVGAVPSSETESNIKKEDNEDGEATTVEVEEKNEESFTLIMLKALSIHEDATASSSIGESCLSDISQESKPKLRLRTKSPNETAVSEKQNDRALPIKTSRPGVARGYAIWLAAMMTVVLLGVGIWTWERYQSQWIPWSSL